MCSVKMNKEDESLSEFCMFSHCISHICISFPFNPPFPELGNLEWGNCCQQLQSGVMSSLLIHPRCQAFDMIISNTHLGTKKNVQKIQVSLLDLVKFLLTGEQHLSFFYYLICVEE